MNLNNYLFGPVNSKFCAYFYYLSVIQFVVMIFMLMSLLYMLTLGSKKIDVKTVSTIVMGTLAYGVLYFQSRLLHSMCIQRDSVEEKIKDKKKKKN